jgi:hypothetical protein
MRPHDYRSSNYIPAIFGSELRNDRSVVYTSINHRTILTRDEYENLDVYRRVTPTIRSRGRVTFRTNRNGFNLSSRRETHQIENSRRMKSDVYQKNRFIMLL